MSGRKLLDPTTYVRTCICVYVRMYVCMYAHMCMCLCMYLRTYVCRICIYVFFVCVCVCVYMHVCVFMRGLMYCRLPHACATYASMLRAYSGYISSSSHFIALPRSAFHCRISEQAVRGRPMVQSVGRLTYTGENRLPSQASTCGACGRQVLVGHFLSEFFRLFSQYK